MDFLWGNFMDEEYIVVDRHIVPEFISKMNTDELNAFIAEKDRKLCERKRQDERNSAVRQTFGKSKESGKAAA